MADQKQEKAEVHKLPEGRVINHSLFVKDIYVDPVTKKAASPSYKIEMAFTPAELDPHLDVIMDLIEKTWGAAAVDDYLDAEEGKASRFRWSFNPSSGDKKAGERAAKGKEGDAYAGKLVLRAHTEFDRDGKNGPAGVPVYGPAVEKIGLAEGNDSLVFEGCYGILAVTLKPYETNGNRYITHYIQAFQKTRGTDEDRLRKGADRSGLFAPVAGGVAGVGAARRRRVG